MKIFKINIGVARVAGLLVMLEIITVNISCKKFVEIAPPSTQIADVNVFADDKAALSAATAVYAEMSVSYLDITSGGMTVFPALSADELIYTAVNADFESFQNNSVLASGQSISAHMWVPAYRDIYYANEVLEGVANSKTISESARNQLTGEMLVVRALNYFCLVNLFGDVPLELTTDYRVNSLMPRTPVKDVYTQLSTDLLKAKGLLSGDYPTAMRARVNKWTAAALLARVNLYQKDWANAEAQATAVISSGQYTLEADLNSVFSQASNETIWQLANDVSNTAEAAEFVPYDPGDIPTYVLSDFLVAAFEPNDRRYSKWIDSNTVDNHIYRYPYKYKDNNYDPVTEFYVVFRLAEQYLIRAEARAEQGNIEGAVSDINIIRARAGLAGITTTDKDSVLTAIAHEREVELFCEWGHRWCDLKRTGTANAVLGVRKAPNWQPNDTVYPLPANELVNNPFLVQNPGY